MKDLFQAAEEVANPDVAEIAATSGPSPITMVETPRASEPIDYDDLFDRLERLENEDRPERIAPHFNEVRRQLKPSSKDGPPNLLQRILAAQRAVDAVAKDKRNSEQNYKYSSVDEIVGASRVALIENGIFVQITPSRKISGAYQTSNGKSGRQVEAFSTITVINVDDPEELIEYEISGFVQAVGDKQEWVLSAQFRKYALIELLNLERGSADDQEAQKGGDDVKSRGSWQQQRSGGQSSGGSQTRSSAPASSGSSDRQPARPEISGSTTTRDMMIQALKQGAPKAGGKPITENQAKRLFAVAKSAGYTREQVVESLGEWFRMTPADLPWQLYDGVVNLFQKYPTTGAEQKPADNLDGDID